ncbi:MAG: zinc-dependent alcohol dehydrogenase family protein [Planctomycetaceae bacterium]|nr:zinc-dependent alcohol dehydrogenase family protein [Planctomycetaceae bacterium]
MQHVCFTEYGEPSDVLQCGDTHGAKPGRGQVHVRMIASPINPSDLMFIRGQYGVKATFPQTPGFEGVGVVTESGGGLRGRLFQGKRVVVLNRKGGNWAQSVVVPAENVVPVSSKLSDFQAATSFVNPMTAWVMTQEILGVPSGAWLIQTAAASSLGRMVIRLCEHLGIPTLNIVRSQHSEDLLRNEGVANVLRFDPEHSDPDQLCRFVAERAGPPGVGYAIDPVGGVTAAQLLRCLRPCGRLLLYGTLSNEPLVISPRDLMTRQIRVDGFWLGNFMDQCRLLKKLRLIRRVTDLISRGILPTHVQQTFPLSEIRQAVLTAESSENSGKVLLMMTEPQETSRQ